MSYPEPKQSYSDLPEYDEPWVECWSCGGEGFHEDCFEDCCVCLNPPCRRVTCEECNGRGGWPEGSEA